jgi:hypothetical protein
LEKSSTIRRKPPFREEVDVASTDATRAMRADARRNRDKLLAAR